MDPVWVAFLVRAVKGEGHRFIVKVALSHAGNGRRRWYPRLHARWRDRQRLSFFIYF